MCLYLRYKEECIATSNIYVWKGLVSSIGFYYSPVFNYRYDLGETYKSELDRNEDSIVVSRGLHSFGYNVKYQILMLEDMTVMGFHIIVLILRNLLIL